MYSKNQICEKIRSIYPDIGKCGIGLNVKFDKSNDAWIVDLKKENQELRTYLEPEDANLCMEAKQCIGLGLQISQLKDNIKHMNYS